MATTRTATARPRPPAGLVSMAEITAPALFVPAPELADWVTAAYLTEGGPLYNPDHQHLAAARLGFLWTNVENTRRGRRILGQAEIPGGGDKWAAGRKDQQLRQWFERTPDFVITLDAFYADDCDDRAWCCLIEHELRHCVQALDADGEVKFNQATGEPVWAIKPHDIEAFVGDVARYGPEGLGDEAVDFVLAAANRAHQLTDRQIAIACGRAVPRMVGAA